MRVNDDFHIRSNNELLNDVKVSSAMSFECRQILRQNEHLMQKFAEFSKGDDILWIGRTTSRKTGAHRKQSRLKVRKEGRRKKEGRNQANGQLST